MEENKRLSTRSGYCQRCACVVCMTSAISWPNCVFAVARIHHIVNDFHLRRFAGGIQWAVSAKDDTAPGFHPWTCPCRCVYITEMPLFRKFPEIRKFQIERKNFRKNETASVKIKIIDQKGGKRFGKIGNCIKNSLIKNQYGNLFHTLVISRVF